MTVPSRFSAIWRALHLLGLALPGGALFSLVPGAGAGRPAEPDPVRQDVGQRAAGPGRPARASAALVVLDRRPDRPWELLAEGFQSTQPAALRQVAGALPQPGREHFVGDVAQLGLARRRFGVGAVPGDHHAEPRAGLG